MTIQIASMNISAETVNDRIIKHFIVYSHDTHNNRVNILLHSEVKKKKIIFGEHISHMIIILLITGADCLHVFLNKRAFLLT